MAETLRELRRYPQRAADALAFLLYNDGIQTMIRMSSIYGAEPASSNAQIAAFVLVQFVGIPFSFLFGCTRRPDRREARGVPLTGRLHHRQLHRILHVQTWHFFALAVPGRHGPGRQPGAQPIALREDDPARQVVGVLRILLGV